MDGVTKEEETTAAAAAEEDPRRYEGNNEMSNTNNPEENNTADHNNNDDTNENHHHGDGEYYDDNHKTNYNDHGADPVGEVRDNSNGNHYDDPNHGSAGGGANGHREDHHSSMNNNNDGGGGGPMHGGDDNAFGGVPMRAVFLGNLHSGYATEDVIALFERPLLPPSLEAEAKDYGPIGVERIDLKRGYCFVFLKNAADEAERDRIERFVDEIHGMRVPRVSDSLRVEIARGDGRIKRKEDERRKNIAPSETLFVVNFNEATTKREDLECLFERFGELVRIDMKRNYAFIQFKNIEEATRAKDVINGGKLDQSVLTVEYVARHRADERRRDRRMDGRFDGGGGRRFGGRSYDDRRRYNDGPMSSSFRGGGGGGAPPSMSYTSALGGGGMGMDRFVDGRDRRYMDRERFAPRVGGAYMDDRPRRSRSPQPMYRPRRSSRSRSRSPLPGGVGVIGGPPPPRYNTYRDRSPPRGGLGRYDDRYRDDFRGGGVAVAGGRRLSPHLHDGIGGGGPPPMIGGGGGGDWNGGRGRSPMPPVDDMRGGGPPGGDYRALLDHRDRDRGYRA